MSILHYLRRKDGFSDSKGSLSDSITSAAKVSMNHEVQEALASVTKKKRDPYTK